MTTTGTAKGTTIADAPGATKRPQLIPAAVFLWVFALALLVPGTARANGADLPPQIELQAFLKQDDGHLVLLVRVPLELVASFNLPKRASGFLDLEHMDAPLKEVAAASGKQIELRADGTTLAPTVKAARLSLLSDRSFASYASARAHLEGPPLPPATELYW